MPVARDSYLRGPTESSVPVANGKQTPFAGDPFEDISTPVLELKPRPGYQIFDGARHEDLAGSGMGRDPRADVHRNTAQFRAYPLALARVQPSSDLDPQVMHRTPNRVRASDRPGWAIEGRQDAITNHVNLLSPIAVELPPHKGMIALQEIAPALVA